MVSASPPITMGWLNFKICQNFAVAFFLHLWQDKLVSVELNIYGGAIFIAILAHFRYLISLETANTKESEVFLLRISSGNLNKPVATCWKEFFETLCKYIYLEL